MEEYRIVIAHDEKAAVWYVESSNIAGLALEDRSYRGLFEKLPAAIDWLRSQRKEPTDVPFEVVLATHERVHAAD